MGEREKVAAVLSRGRSVITFCFWESPFVNEREGAGAQGRNRVWAPFGGRRKLATRAWHDTKLAPLGVGRRGGCCWALMGKDPITPMNGPWVEGQHYFSEGGDFCLFSFAYGQQFATWEAKLLRFIRRGGAVANT